MGEKNQHIRRTLRSYIFAAVTLLACEIMVMLLYGCGCVCVCVFVCVREREREFIGEFDLEERPAITYCRYKDILGEL